MDMKQDHLDKLLERIDEIDDDYHRKDLRKLVKAMVFDIRYRNRSLYDTQEDVKQCYELINKWSFVGSAIYINVNSLSGAKILKDIQIYGKYADEALYHIFKASIETLKERIDFEEKFSLTLAKETLDKSSKLLEKIDKERAEKQETKID